jgi:signal transduction histidine kinase
LTETSKRNSFIRSAELVTSLRKLLDHRHTVAFRLTVLYAGIFAISLFAAFLGFYVLVLYTSHDISKDALSALREDFREYFGTTLIIVILFAAAIGHFLAKRALSGVAQLTRTAEAIALGALHERVPLKGGRNEIDRLAATFNGMLERIEALILSMKQVNDNIAHDLRSPLTRMRGIAEMPLINADTPDEFRSIAGSIVEECDRLLVMVDTMLDISEAETGMARLAMESVDISLMARDAVELFEPVAEDKNIALDFSGPTCLQTSVDRQKLQRVFANLLDNAVKYTAPGGRITVAVGADDRHILITVTDTGMGLSEYDLPHIFERFFRAEKSRSEPGSGLGLSLAQAFVKAHEGTIEVRSVLDEGSTFTVKLPPPSS